MNTEIWKDFWNAFCESQTHFDSLIHRLDTPDKKRVATVIGPFLRRPWTIAKSLGIDLAGSPEEFWKMNFLALKKNPAIHVLFPMIEDLIRQKKALPTQGGIHDFPTQWIERWTQDWGHESTDRMAQLLSQDPLTVLRVNRKHTDAEFPGSRPGRFSRSARIFKGYASVKGTETDLAGGFEFQDEGSQLMSRFAVFPEVFSNVLSPTPQIKKQTEVPNESLLTRIDSKTVWIDACAGAGGKTLAMADALDGQGRVYAYDVSERKIDALRRRVARAQETNIQGKWIKDSSDLELLQTQFKSSADGVLVDAPCSGHGVLRRNPDQKWNRQPRSLPEASLKIEDLQMKVVRDYLPLVKKGGRLVYGVCTFEKSETVDQIRAIAHEFSNTLTLEQHGFIGPYETDGFFMASFLKK